MFKGVKSRSVHVEKIDILVRLRSVQKLHFTSQNAKKCHNMEDSKAYFLGVCHAMHTSFCWRGVGGLSDKL